MLFSFFWKLHICIRELLHPSCSNQDRQTSSHGCKIQRRTTVMTQSGERRGRQPDFSVELKLTLLDFFATKIKMKFKALLREQVAFITP